MPIGKAVRAYAGSAAVCAVVLLAVWGITQHQLHHEPAFSSMPTERLERLERSGEAALIASGAAFAIAALFVYLPIFILLDAYLRRPISRTRAVLVGVILALAPRVFIAWMFEEAGSVTAWLLYWARHMESFPYGFLLFAIPGAIFGLLWSRPAPHAAAGQTV